MEEKPQQPVDEQPIEETVDKAGKTVAELSKSTIQEDGEMPAAPAPPTSQAPEQKQHTGLVIGTALIVALILTLVGVLAYQKGTEVPTIEGELPVNTEVIEEPTGPVSGSELQVELDSIESDLSELDSVLNDFEEDSLTDQALGLE